MLIFLNNIKLVIHILDCQHRRSLFSVLFPKHNYDDVTFLEWDEKTGSQKRFCHLDKVNSAN